MNLTDDHLPFLRDIKAAPDDDAPRLIYADWLQEQGQESRAEFIKVQVKLAGLGPPPIVVTERCVVSKRYGPDYYTLTGGEGTDRGRLCLDPRFAVGARIDVMRPRGRKEPMLGLRIHKTNNGPQQDEVVVVRDDKSGPWEGWGLVDRERELLPEAFHNGWIPTWRGGIILTTPRTNGHPGSGKPVVTSDRGFVSKIRMTAETCIEHFDAVLEQHPVEEVELTTIRRNFFQGAYVDSRNRRYEFHLAGKEVCIGMDSFPTNNTDSSRIQWEKAIFEARWPRVRFTFSLFPGNATIGADELREAVEQFQNGIRRYIRSAGLDLPVIPDQGFFHDETV